MHMYPFPSFNKPSLLKGVFPHPSFIILGEVFLTGPMHKHSHSGKPDSELPSCHPLLQNSSTFSFQKF